MKKYIVKIPKNGQKIKLNDYYSPVVGHKTSEELVEEARRDWKNTIKSKFVLKSRFIFDQNHIPPSYIDYYIEDNPYYGWSENQLKIELV